MNAKGRPTSTVASLKIMEYSYRVDVNWNDIYKNITF